MSQLIRKIVTLFTILSLLMGKNVVKEETYTEYTELRYGLDNEQSVMLCVPDDKQEMGLMVLIHGGGWEYGHKEETESEMLRYCKTYGVAACSLGYRRINDWHTVDAEDMLEDITNGLNLIREIGEREGFRFTSMAIWGGSAGGHLALLYAYRCAEEAPFPIRFVCSVSGPTDLSAPENFIETSDYSLEDRFDTFGSVSGTRITESNLNSERVQNALKEASPITYVTSESLPTLLLYGDSDTLVPYRNGVDLKGKLDTLGVDCEFYTLRNAGHTGVASDPEDIRYNDEIKEEYQAKIEEYLKLYLGAEW